jgi:hypothetical protein
MTTRRTAFAGLIVLTGALASFGCASGHPGSASSYLIINSLTAASGARPSLFGGTLGSDVLTMVKVTVNGVETLVPTIFEDQARVTLSLGMKDPSPANRPSPINFITLRGYRVTYTRADGRNTPGVDVPYPFDGAMTITVGEDPVIANMVLVRVQAKQEAPLLALIGGGGAIAISTLADIVFFGVDQAGRDVTVTARISVNFADWGDPL